MESGCTQILQWISLLILILLQIHSCVADDKQERTLAIIKPDGIRGNFSNEIRTIITSSGFTIVAEKNHLLDETEAKEFYSEHSQRQFFPSLVEFMTSGPILAMVIEKEDAITQWRALIGPTDARVAKVTHPKSIRALCGLDTQNNCVHGSDSHSSAAREIAFFFGINKSDEAVDGHDEL